jgi:hypothetical protein
MSRFLTSRQGLRTARSLAVPLLVSLLLAGCGYSIRPPYEHRVRTVYVPVFKSVSFRRDLNLQLTKLVQEEIERRTPYKVVGTRDGADATLDGVITLADKNIMVENPENLPRQLIANMTVNVRLTDNTSGETVEELNLPPVPVNENMVFFGELGETTELGFDKVLQKIARDIVNMMEEEW